MSIRTVTVEQARELAKKKPRGAKSAKARARFASTPPLVQTESERLAQRALFERHDEAAWTIRFPLSPTANNLKSIRSLPGRRPFLVPSTMYNVYKQAVEAAWKAHWEGRLPEPLNARLRVRVIVHQARGGGDIINREKAAFDALTGLAWEDDSQIDDVHFIRGNVIPGVGAMDISVEVIGT